MLPIIKPIDKDFFFVSGNNDRGFENDFEIENRMVSDNSWVLIMDVDKEDAEKDDADKEYAEEEAVDKKDAEEEAVDKEDVVDDKIPNERFKQGSL